MTTFSRPRALVFSPLAERRAELRHRFRDAGYDVWECRSAAAVLDVLRREGAMAVAAIDWSADGALNLAREIRSERAFDVLRLLMLTPDLRAEELIPALDAGVDDYLPWPCGAYTFIEKLWALGLAVNCRSRSASSGSKGSRG